MQKSERLEHYYIKVCYSFFAMGEDESDDYSLRLKGLVFLWEMLVVMKMMLIWQ